MVSGILCSTVTPFLDNGAIDMAAYRRHLAGLMEAGCQGVVVNALTGEGGSMSATERTECVAAARDVARTGWYVVACVGAGARAELLLDAAAADAAGADALFITAPHLDDVFQLAAFASGVRSTSRLPVVLYNKQCPSAWKPEHLASLVREVPGILGIAEGNPAQLAQTVQHVGGGVKVYCTRDSYIHDSAAVGAAGAVSFASNLVATKVSRLWRAIVGGDTGAALAFQGEVTELVTALLERNLTASLKAAMNELHLPGGRVRPPLSDLAPNDVADLMSCISYRLKAHS